jgi:His-Xaa-Ser system radical SAM maturase HxsB/His-Xaa-Ser system protein HxsD
LIEVKKGIYKEVGNSDSISIVLHKEYFEKEPIMEAIHEYTNHYIVNMQPRDEFSVGITFSKKANHTFDENLVMNFSNRVVDYQIRRDLENKYGKIRDIIVEYAYSPIKKKLVFDFKIESVYSFFPFSFKMFDDKDMLLVNMAGEHIFISEIDFSQLISYQLYKNSEIYKNLKAKFFIFDHLDELNIGIELLSTQIRTKQRYLLNFTSLQMVEITNYCNLSCDYCHASSVSTDNTGSKKSSDLRKEITNKTVDLMFQSPSPNIKIELQGGEPLVNWESCKYLIERASEVSKNFPEKRTEIILCTNLILIDIEKLEFLKKYKVQISTSLDGTQELHDKHRFTHSGKGSYNKFIENLELTRKILGRESVGALLTITSSNLYKLREVIDEYVRLGFSGIFIRALNPYGMATKNLDQLGYPTEEFVNEYKKALKYIIELNLKGIHFNDYYTSILLRRILTPFSTGFVDLQSPAGAGISAVIFDFNGDVFPTDESRMLARTGNYDFKIGNVLKNSYTDIFLNDKLINITKSSILTTTPTCSNCIYLTFCGSDPVRNFVESGNIVGYKPDSSFCHKHMMLFDYFFELIKENDPNIMNVFWSWATMRNVGDMKI